MSGPANSTLAGPNTDLGAGLLAQLTSSTNAFRDVLYSMLGLYSAATLAIAGFIILYYVILSVVDAAQTGTAWRRINPVWGPLRLIIVIGLLVPLPGGLNAGQHLVLTIAGWGSSLASTLWNVAARDTIALQRMVAMPEPVPALSLVRALVLRDVCQQYTSLLADQELAKYNKAVDAAGENPTGPLPQPPTIKRVGALAPLANQDTSTTTPYGWAERPYFCGAVSVYSPQGGETELFADIKTAHVLALSELQGSTERYAGGFIERLRGASETLQTQDADDLAERYADRLQRALNTIREQKLDNYLTASSAQVAPLGWVAAAAYLDTALRLNVRLLSLTASLPQIDPPELLLNPPPPRVLADGKLPPENAIYRLLQRVGQSWGNVATVPPFSVAGFSGLSLMLGQSLVIARAVDGVGSTGHLLRATRDMLRFDDYDWKSLEGQPPLASLAEIGTYLTGKSVELLAGAGVLNSIGPVTAPSVTLFTTLGMVGFLASLGLLLLLPLIPLMRFLAGVAVWLLQVFETLVAIPLVALAHARADEDGIAGQSAVMCYLLILQVVLRPPLMVLGLLGGLAVFLIILGVLHQLLAGLMQTVSGSGQIASLWFMLLSTIYSLLALGIANACFKLIDWLPHRTLTWLSGFMQSRTPAPHTPVADAGKAA